MLRTYGVPWIDRNSLEFLGYMFFSTPREACEHVEAFYACYDRVPLAELPFGCEGQPRHGLNGFILEQLEVPETTLIALSTAPAREGEKMLRENMTALVSRDDGPDCWFEIRNLRVIGKPFEIPYMTERPVAVHEADVIPAWRLIEARERRPLRPAEQPGRRNSAQERQRLTRE